MQIKSSTTALWIYSVFALVFVLFILWREDSSATISIVAIVAVVLFGYGLVMTYANDISTENERFIVSNRLKLWNSNFSVRFSELKKVAVRFGPRGEPFIYVYYYDRRHIRFGTLGASNEQLEELVELLKEHGVQADVHYKWKQSKKA